MQHRQLPPPPLIKMSTTYLHLFHLKTSFQPTNNKRPRDKIGRIGKDRNNFHWIIFSLHRCGIYDLCCLYRRNFNFIVMHFISMIFHFLPILPFSWILLEFLFLLWINPYETFKFQLLMGMVQIPLDCGTDTTFNLTFSFHKTALDFVIECCLIVVPQREFS